MKINVDSLLWEGRVLIGKAASHSAGPLFYRGDIEMKISNYVMLCVLGLLWTGVQGADADDQIRRRWHEILRPRLEALQRSERADEQTAGREGLGRFDGGAVSRESDAIFYPHYAHASIHVLMMSEDEIGKNQLGTWGAH